MRYALFDYQRDAALGCLNRLDRGRRDWHTYNSLSGFALSAITGAGKTVIATAVVEAILHGSSDLEVDADPRAAFLWVTDDPALNRQTRNKMLAGSDVLQPARLRILDNDFLDSSLEAGRVYFLNIQKLSRSSGLSHGGRNLRQHSLWDVLANTVAAGTVDLHLVVDEAHRGMQRVPDRSTIVQRLISGSPGSNPPMPVVWGISATIDRFATAMQGSTNRTYFPHVEVDIERVRASGLIKDEIGIIEPDEKGAFGNTLLREAVKATIDYDAAWRQYALAQNEPTVVPALVVQVPDKTTPAKLEEIVGVIESEWPGLGPSAIAHVFGEHDRLHLSGRVIEWIPPESIESISAVRVVLAKTAISTGWDCPRAEVLYSERPAKDVTHIAQIIGRMVRAPLARRITTDDVLNSVSCFLPLFDRAALATIKSELEGTSSEGAESRVAATIVRAPILLRRNSGIDVAAFAAIEAIPSLSTPNALANPVRRAKELARLLTDTADGEALLPSAGAHLTRQLMGRLDGMAAQYSDEVNKNVANIETAGLSRTIISTSGGQLSESVAEVPTHLRDVERETRRIINSLKEGTGKDFFAHRANAARTVDLLRTRTETAAILMLADVGAEIDREATRWTQSRLAEFNAAIKNTSGASREAFRRIQEQTTSPEPVTIELRDSVIAASRGSDGAPLESFPGHLYADGAGLYPMNPNGWERTIIRAEIARSSFVAWYRNPSQPSSSALRIPYQSTTGRWASLQVDFLFVSRRSDGSLGVSIVDPHGDHLADARTKLEALARYADQHGQAFVRIESVSQAADGSLRLLDLQQAAVRSAVLNQTTTVTELYASDLAVEYW
ncbi:MAG: type restriction endonuclease subunit [Ilumatobacteraceae bacterium]|nr:type restriction endonuclease subunit [Ilumatobacteraceae bacterium]